MQDPTVSLDVYKDWLGIPEGPRPPDHYQLLRLVQFEDDAGKIRQHYKKLNTIVRKYATGQYSVESQELLNELAKAMLCLTDPERKREYDESLGRVFEEPADAMGRKPLESLLVEQGHITREQMREAQEFAEARGLSMRDAVVQMKLVDAETAAAALAQELGLSYIDLSETLPDDSVLDRLPRNIVKRNSILPLFVDDDMLLLACIDELSHELEDELRLRFEMPIRRVIATPLAINQGIAQYYAPGMRDEALAEASSGSSGKTKKKSKAEKPQPAKRPARSRKLTDEERQERKNWGILFMGWSVIGSVAFDHFVLKPYVLPSTFTFPYLTALVVPPAVIWYVLKVYWKE